MPGFRHRSIGVALLAALSVGWLPVVPLNHAERCGHGCATGVCRCDPEPAPTSPGAHCHRGGTAQAAGNRAPACHLREAPEPNGQPAERPVVDPEASRRALLAGGAEGLSLEPAGRLAAVDESLPSGQIPRPPTPPPRLPVSA